MVKEPSQLPKAIVHPDFSSRRARLAYLEALAAALVQGHIDEKKVSTLGWLAQIAQSVTKGYDFPTTKGQKTKSEDLNFGEDIEADLASPNDTIEKIKKALPKSEVE